MGKTIIFKDRTEAGQMLASELLQFASENPVVLGMPRGGVVLAYEIAQALHAPLDVIVARKIGAPGQPEYAIGAIAPGGIRIFNPEAMPYFEGNSPEIEELIRLEQLEMERRIKLYRGDHAELDVKNKTVIIVDDGLATGQSALAAIRSVRQQHPKKIVLAVGACALSSARILQAEVDILVCLSMPEYFYAVGEWYQDFSQTSDQEVIDLLSKNRRSMV